MAVFKAFKPEAMNKIAKAMGYSGDMGQFQSFIEQDPARQARMEQFKNAAVQMAKGGAVQRANVVKMQTGGTPDPNLIAQSYVPTQEFKDVTRKEYAPPDSSQLLKGQTFSTFQDYSVAMQQAAKKEAEAKGEDFDAAKYKLPDPRRVDVQRAPTVGDITAQMMTSPGLPTGATVKAAQITPKDAQKVSAPDDLTDISMTAETAATAKATAAAEKSASKVTASQTSEGVKTALDSIEAAEGEVSEGAKAVAAEATESMVGDLDAATGKAIKMDSPNTREIQDGELIDGVANADKAAKFAEQIQAAEATPSKQATVQGQLEGLMAQFEGGETPPWAAGAMRAATQAMASRGLGASSLAGQALVQAAMESALPIAQADAGVIASFEQMNLSNRQQRAMLAAEQRAKFIGQEFDQAFQARVQNATKIADVANINFTAEQQIALENSRIANTMNLQNLSNKQALVMSEAASLANLDTANLNNRQQAAVQNAQAFLQMDMANLTNEQQTNMFKAQQQIQSLFTDAAATNAARQFNATSENQVNQFFANLKTQTSQFNASQSNAQNQFNAGQKNSINRFVEETNNQRDQFNSQNALVVSQSNAQWRRQIATANTAAVNRANELNANALLDISNTAYNNLWQYYGDTLEYSWNSTEKERDRMNAIAVERIRQEGANYRQKYEDDTNSSIAFGKAIFDLFTPGGIKIPGFG